MKAITVLILISSSVLLVVACSKEEPVINSAHTCEGCSGESSQMPTYDKKFLKQWEKKQGEVKVQMAAKRHPQTRVPKMVQQNQPQKKTSVPVVHQPRYTITPGARFTELCGREVDWAIDPNRYIPRTLEGSPTNRIDSLKEVISLAGLKNITELDLCYNQLENSNPLASLPKPVSQTANSFGKNVRFPFGRQI